MVSGLLALASTESAMAIPRNEVMDNAALYAYHGWHCAEANLSVDCSTDWESDYTVGDYTGIPYKWGGYDTVEEFDQKLADGYGAGSHSWHGILSCVTGEDCSGFVSLAWETSARYTTSSFYEVTTDISTSQVQTADAFNDAGSHIVLHAYFRDDGVPAFYEAAGGPSKVRFTAAQSWSYLNGFTPVRYDGIEASTPQDFAGTLSDPIVVSRFPYSDSRNTVTASSDEFDEYICKTGTYERGPEYIYLLDFNGTGTLTASLTDELAVDIDLHLLSDLDESACLTRNDVGFTFDITTPGRYYLVADTWSSSSSAEEYPGPYSVSIDFLPDDAGDGSGCSARAESWMRTGAGKTGKGAGVAPFLLVSLGLLWRRRRV